MSFITVEAVSARNAELRRVADRHRAQRAAHHGPAPQRPPRPARRTLRTAAAAAAAVTRVAR